MLVRGCTASAPAWNARGLRSISLRAGDVSFFADIVAELFGIPGAREWVSQAEDGVSAGVASAVHRKALAGAEGARNHSTKTPERKREK